MSEETQQPEPASEAAAPATSAPVAVVGDGYNSFIGIKIESTRWKPYFTDTAGIVIPEGTPEWMKEPKTSTLVFKLEGHEDRKIHFSAPKPFKSFDEFKALVKFVNVDNNDGAALVTGFEQDPIVYDSITVSEDGKVVHFTTDGTSVRPGKYALALDRLHSKLWIHCRPFVAPPVTARWWWPVSVTKTPSAPAASKASGTGGGRKKKSETAGEAPTPAAAAGPASRVTWQNHTASVDGVASVTVLRGDPTCTAEVTDHEGNVHQITLTRETRLQAHEEIENMVANGEFDKYLPAKPEPEVAAESAPEAPAEA